MDWVGDPYCYHRYDLVHWSVDSVRIGQNMMRDPLQRHRRLKKCQTDRPFSGDMAATIGSIQPASVRGTRSICG
jgi:hypothetical protein